MLPETLKVSVLYGTGEVDVAFAELLEKEPRVQIVGQARNPEEYFEEQQGKGADLILVYQDHDPTLPEWLETLTVTYPRAAVVLCAPRLDAEFLLRAMRLGVREVLPLPLSPEELAASVDRVLVSRKRLRELGTTPGHIIVVTGAKGGVGTTTVAVNLAYALAEVQDERVVLVDLGRPYPDVGHFLDREGQYTLFDLIQNQADLDQAFLEKIAQPYEKNLSLIYGVADFHDQENLDLGGLRKVFELLRTSFRWTVVDLSHWLDELFLQVVQDADLALMLTELSVPELRNLAHLWPNLREWQQVHQNLRLVINRYERGNGLGLNHLEQLLKQKPYFTLPSDYANVSEAINRGIPLAKVSSKSKLWLSLQQLAGQLLTQFHQAEEGKRTPVRKRFWVF